MARELFDYSKTYLCDYEYHGFHIKSGRCHIDTKRLKKLEEDNFFPRGLFTKARNTHYFIPKYKKKTDWAINILIGCLNKLSNDWKNEFQVVIDKIETPSQVQEKVRMEETMYTSCSDDLDQIYEDAFMASIYRIPKYEEVIKSIYLQYIQKIFVEYFRTMLNVIKKRGYENNDDFYYSDLCKYVQKKFNSSKETNPIYKLPNYKYFALLNKIDNFLKHNTLSTYNALACDPFEQDVELKSFYASYVFTKEEAGKSYNNGYYAGNWLKIGPTFIYEILGYLKDFSKEFCKLMYDEDAEEASWNSDESLKKILEDEILYAEW